MDSKSLDQMPELSKFYVFARRNDSEDYIPVVDSGSAVLPSRELLSFSKSEMESAIKELKNHGYEQTIVVPVDSKKPNLNLQSLYVLNGWKVVESSILPGVVEEIKKSPDYIRR